MALLEGRGLSKRFGGVQALENVDFEVDAGTIVGLIGPNGAGKTTLFNIVAGAFPPSAGAVFFKGEAITEMPAFRICRQGIARTFQVTRPFGEMTCLENVAVAAVNRHPGCSRDQWMDLAGDSLEAVGLGALKDTEAKHLNVIQKKRLEIARSLATEPTLLMLDEVLGGLNTQEIQEAIVFIRRLRDERNLTIFWIEHVMGAIMQATEKVIVLDQGKILMVGPPGDVVADERVIHAYLGD
ncbi:MAG: ABC transporter ATP-binding protein [Desulfobacterales bacterium]